MNNLDQHLKEWGRRRDAESAVHPDRLVARVRARLVPGAPVPAGLTRHLFYTRLALAASLAVLAAVTVLYLRRGPAAAPAPVGISAAELDDLRQAVAEVQRMFPEGVRWISLSAGQLSVQAGAPNRIEVGAPGRPVVVRYQLLERDRRGAWQVLATRSIVTFPDEPVALPGDHLLNLWCHLVSPSLALVQSELTIGGVHVAQQSPQSMATSAVVYEGQRNGAAIRVVQTLAQI